MFYQLCSALLNIYLLLPLLILLMKHYLYSEISCPLIDRRMLVSSLNNIKVMQMIIHIICRFFEKVYELLSNSYGWLLSSIIFLVNFVSPEKYSFVALAIAVSMDLIFGISASIIQGKFFLSYALRETPGKIFIYFGFLLVVYAAELIFGNDTHLITKGCSALACGCELWSMLASALIIKPNMLFPRLLKIQLKGEIESKFGKNISNQFKDKEVNNDNTKGDKE